MALFTDLFWEIRAYGHNPHTAPIKLGTQFLESPQLGDTVGSPVRAEKFYEYEVPVQTVRVEEFSPVIGSGEMGDRIAHLDDVCRDLLRTDGNGEWKKQANKNRQGCRHCAGPARSLDECSDTENSSREKGHNEERPILREVYLSGEIKPQYSTAEGQREGQYAEFCTRLHQISSSYQACRYR